MSLPPLPDYPTAPPKKQGSGILLWLIIPLALGLILAPLAVPKPEKPAIGLIRLETDIWYLSAWFVKEEIAEARANDRVKAIVLVIDSPGGEVAPTQDMFMEILSLRQEMPVVGSINGMAASGGYYLALATDPLYAKPSSTVGNIGVWGFAPTEIGVTEAVLASGPFKLTASNPEQFLREIEGIKQEFIGTTQLMRGDRLTISAADISQGFAYPGRLALQYGLIDKLASQADAVAEAARQAGLEDYEVLDLEKVVTDRLLAEQAASDGAVGELPNVQTPDFANTAPSETGVSSQAVPWLFQTWIGAPNPLTGERNLPPGIYLLYDVSFATQNGGEK
ncbi:MAG TPA: S49 family peptidase [Anaerolineales bacterium]|nr:S49 family peptidase [Anaerolineales bacterium]